MTNDTPSILLIESNVFLAGILQHRLKQYDLQLVKVKDGKEGLTKLVENHCSLAVVDLPIEDLNIFFNVMRKLSTQKGFMPPPVVVLSNVESDQEIKRISEMGATAYLIKAYTDADEIVNKITSIIEDLGDEIREVEPEEPETPEQPTTVAKVKPEDEDHADRSRKEKSEKKEFAPTVSAHKRLQGEIEKIVILAERNEQDDEAIVNLVDHMIEFGSVTGASDIHFKPEKDALLVRMRIDGILRDAFRIPKKLHGSVITRLKVMGGMRTDEHQAAQDGRMRTNIKRIKKQFDIRVSIVPTYHGEDAVLRLLIEKASIEKIADIPFSDADREKVEAAIKKPYGMILATGPTGSGKTTTLYTVLKELNTPDISIITIEDPIEYSLKGINQIQVNARTDLTFANGLRSILRQDPDIIMVGEIRDKETAGIAVNAALTGHKLLSTLHTNDAATTLPRLLDMGVEPFLIASTVNVAIGQRLLRKLCQSCKVEQTMSPQERKSLTRVLPAATLKKYTTFYGAKGCKKCETGYVGRLGIYEVLEVDEEIRSAIIERKDADEIKRIALAAGMTTLMEDGIAKASEGLTTVEEVLRVAQE